MEKYAPDTVAPVSRSGWSFPVRFGLQLRIAATPSSVEARVVQSTNKPGEMTSRLGPPLALRSCHTMTRRSGSAYGSGRRRTPATKLKTVVLAPMPSARARIAAAVVPGCRRQVRSV